MATTTATESPGTRDAINHAVLKKHDPALSQIIFTSSICDVYKFDSDGWRQMNVKGTLFLYARVSTDGFPYALLVLNRNNNADFYLGIQPRQMSLKYGRPVVETALEDSVVMIQPDPNNVYGLWLFDSSDRQTVLSLIQWCIMNGSTQ